MPQEEEADEEEDEDEEEVEDEDEDEGEEEDDEGKSGESGSDTTVRPTQPLPHLLTVLTSPILTSSLCACRTARRRSLVEPRLSSAASGCVTFDVRSAPAFSATLTLFASLARSQPSTTRTMTTSPRRCAYRFSPLKPAAVSHFPARDRQQRSPVDSRTGRLIA